MQDLQEVTHETHYENYRSDKLQPKKQIRTNENDTDEQQKKLIKEKDDEVKSLFQYLCSSQIFLLLASSNARYAYKNARSIS
jgi:septin family protein